MRGSGKFRSLSRVKVVKGGETCELAGKAVSCGKALLLTVNSGGNRWRENSEDFDPEF